MLVGNSEDTEWKEHNKNVLGLTYMWCDYKLTSRGINGE